MTFKQEPMVSVIIPCYNQSHYLGEAISSVLAQTYTQFEIIVVDDGSSDNAAEVAANYPGVRVIRQENQGLPAARNAGFRASRGEYIIFLDSDDRLLPEAMAAGLACFNRHPESGFVFGGYTSIFADGTFKEGPNLPHVATDYYLALLRGNSVVAPAAGMYRRTVVETMNGFSIDINIKGAEDYDMYLRIARKFPIQCHSTVVAEYRHHPTSMSRNAAMMLKSTLTVCRAQRPYIKSKKQYEEMYHRGIADCRAYYSDHVVNHIRAQMRVRGERAQALQNALVLLQHNPRTLVQHAVRKIYCIVLRVKSDFNREHRVE